MCSLSHPRLSGVNSEATRVPSPTHPAHRTHNYLTTLLVVYPCCPVLQFKSLCAAGIVGGKSTGIAKGATIYSVRVLDEQGSGTISTLVDGMNFVANSNLTRRIASMSLGGGFAEALNSAVDAAVKAGVLVIVAAGNEDMDACDTSPGEFLFGCARGVLVTVCAQQALLDCKLCCSKGCKWVKEKPESSQCSVAHVLAAARPGFDKALRVYSMCVPSL